LGFESRQPKIKEKRRSTPSELPHKNAQVHYTCSELSVLVLVAEHAFGSKMILSP